jgi:predicted AlkP superfamily phosphohydrolase/phosphomutase
MPLSGASPVTRSGPSNLSTPAIWWLTILGVAAASVGCQRHREPGLVALFALDGATFDVIQDLRAEGRLPTFDKLIRSGTAGELVSMPSRRLMNANPRRGYWSPILWQTVATGVVPEKHGIQDFLLPVPGTSQVWMGSEDDPPRAELRLPELRGQPPFRLRLRLRSHTPNGPQKISLSLNGTLLESVDVPVEWEELTTEIAPESIRPAVNVLTFGLEKQSRPSDGGVSKDRRLLAAEMSSLEVLDADGRAVISLDPVYARFDLGRGFYQPESEVVEAQSSHGRTLPLWKILGDAGHPVGVVGFWNTWPAYPVNGFLVSSRMGLRGRRQGTTSALTWPLELASELEPLYPSASEMDQTFRRIHAFDCETPLSELHNGLADVLRQDELYFRASKKLLPTLKSGLFKVYFESIDVASHSYIQWRTGTPLAEGCSESARGLVDAVYEEIDRYLGELIGMLPERATVIVVSDHGLSPAGNQGLHSPDGVFIAAGEGIREHAEYTGASLLDIAPTILHRLSAPVPIAMDGKVLAPIYEADWLRANPPRYAELNIEGQVGPGVSREATEDVLERLKALGYIE